MADYTNPNNHPYAGDGADLSEAAAQRHWGFDEVKIGTVQFAKMRVRFKLVGTRRPAGFVVPDPTDCGSFKADHTHGSSEAMFYLKLYLWPAGSHLDDTVEPLTLDSAAAVEADTRATAIGPTVRLLNETSTLKETQGGGEVLEYSWTLEATLNPSDLLADGLLDYLAHRNKRVMSLHPAQLVLIDEDKATTKRARKPGKLTICKADAGQIDAFSGDPAKRGKIAKVDLSDTTQADAIIAEADAEVAAKPTAKRKTAKIAPPGSATK